MEVVVLVPCRSCGSHVRSGGRCPHCGGAQISWPAKTAAAAMLSLALVGCPKSEPVPAPAPDPVPAPAPAEPPEETPEPVPEPPMEPLYGVPVLGEP